MAHRTLFPLTMLVLLAACATPRADRADRAESMSQAPASSASISAGRDLAQVNCGSCHATGAHGDSPNLASPPFRTLSRLYPIETLAESFAEGIFVGHPVMPEFQLDAVSVDDLIAFIASIQSAERPAS